MKMFSFQPGRDGQGSGMAYTAPTIQGRVQGFDRVLAPTSPFRPGRSIPIGAMGLTAETSTINLMPRVPLPAGANMQQNLVTRVSVGWATNPLSTGQPYAQPGNGGSRGQSF